MIGFVTIKPGVHLRVDTITSVRVLPSNCLFVRWTEGRISTACSVIFDSEKLAHKECAKIMSAIDMQLDRANQ